MHHRIFPRLPTKFQSPTTNMHACCQHTIPETSNIIHGVTCAWSNGSYWRTRLGRLRMLSCTASRDLRTFLGTAVDHGVSSSSEMLSHTLAIASHTYHEIAATGTAAATAAATETRSAIMPRERAALPSPPAKHIRPTVLSQLLSYTRLLGATDRYKAEAVFLSKLPTNLYCNDTKNKKAHHDPERYDIITLHRLRLFLHMHDPTIMHIAYHITARHIIARVCALISSCIRCQSKDIQKRTYGGVVFKNVHQLTTRVS